jgi:hypothetical protein
MSGLFKTPAPDSAFSLGDDEDASLGEPDHKVTSWKAQPAAKVAVDPGQHTLGNGSTHTSNGHPPPAETIGSKQSFQAQAEKDEGGAPAAATDAAAPSGAEPTQDLNGKDQPPAAQHIPTDTSAAGSADPAKAAIAESRPSPDSAAMPAAEARASQEEEDEDRIAQACSHMTSCRLLMLWLVALSCISPACTAVCWVRLAQLREAECSCAGAGSAGG